MASIKISIIIGNYNTYKLTKECVDSIYDSMNADMSSNRRHKFKPKCNFEVIVVDDASPDGSGQKLKNLEREYKKSVAKGEGRKLIVLQNLKNLGYVRTNNKGLLKSKGEYKLLLNSDTKVKENSIDNLLEFAEKQQDAGVVGSRLLNKDGSIQDSCFNFPTIWNVIGYKKFAPQGDIPCVVDVVVGASFLITPKAYEQVGRLNEKYTSYFEDFDYCREVYRKGLKTYYLPTSEVIHLHGESFKQLASWDNQWKKMVPSSIKYHGYLKHYTMYIISWVWQKVTGLIKGN